MAHLTPPSPPLLFTKRLTSFLHDSLSTTIHTAALTTPAGRLLAHASRSSPARVLRRQCAVAASLWTIQAESHRASSDADEATPPVSSPASKATTTTSRTTRRAAPVTVHLVGGTVFVILALRCGILLVTVGGTLEPQHGAAASAAQAGSGSTTSGAGAASSARAELMQSQGNFAASSPPQGSPSEAESVLSGVTGAASSMNRATSSAGRSSGGESIRATKLATRVQTERLARLLDEKLGSLSLPEELIIGYGSDAR